jgi:hypothetical protein
LDITETKALRVFFFLFTVTSTNRFYFPSPLSKLLGNVNIVYGNLNSENSSRFCPETSSILYFHEFGFRGLVLHSQFWTCLGGGVGVGRGVSWGSELGGGGGGLYKRANYNTSEVVPAVPLPLGVLVDQIKNHKSWLSPTI